MRMPCSVRLRACAWGLVLCFATSAVRAAHIDVAAPGGVGVVAVATDALCSLREAMLVAHGNDEPDCVMVSDADAGITINLPADAVFTVLDAPYVGLSSRGPNGLPVVLLAYTIDGHGASIRRASSPATPRFRLFYIDGGAAPGNLTLRNLELHNGHTPDAVDMSGAVPVNGGGAILNGGTLTVENCSFHNNRTGDGGYNAELDYNNGSGVGGAIYTLGELIVHNSEFNNNFTGDVDFAGGGGNPADGGDGGAIAGNQTSSISISDSAFTGNQTGRGGTLTSAASGGNGGDGGAIATSGPLNIVRGVFTANAAGPGADAMQAGNGGRGGAVFVDYGNGTISIMDSLFSGNLAGNGGSGSDQGGNGGSGGAVHVLDGNLILSASTLHANRAGDANSVCGYSGHGGAIAVAANADGLTITDSTIIGNHAGGGDSTCSSDDSAGGAMFVNGVVHITNTDIVNNTALDKGGAIVARSSDSELLLQGVTISGNSSARGVVYLADGTTQMQNTTIADNTADTVISLSSTVDQLRLSYVTISANQGIGVHGHPSSEIVVDHSVIAGQLGAPDCGVFVQVVSLDYNRDSDGSCLFDATHDATLADASLGPLGDHGGSVLTLLPALGGPLIDAIPLLDCALNVPTGFAASMDARGGVRPIGTGCDIGAAELQSVIQWRVLDGFDLHTIVGEPFDQPVVVQARDLQGFGVSGLTPAWSVPDSGAGANCTADVTDVTGVSRVHCTANLLPGSYALRIGGDPVFRDRSIAVTLTNDADDRIFVDGFEGSPLAKFALAPSQLVADVDFQVPQALLAERIVSILLAHNAPGQRVVSVEARRDREGIEVRSIQYDAQGYPAHFNDWQKPDASHLQAHIEWRGGTVSSSLHPATQ